MLDFKDNNLNLIRLLAAMQVVLTHSYRHLEINNYIFENILSIISLFPGVPIFFFISGFLISKAYKSNSVLIEYLQNRLLRTYPALWVCFILSITSVLIAGYLYMNDIFSFDFFKWLLAQVSFLQFYNPTFLSWKLIEKPALALKKHPLNPIMKRSKKYE